MKRSIIAGLIAVGAASELTPENVVTTSHAQSPGVQRPTCIDFRGIPVTYAPNTGINDIAIATHHNGAPVVYYNPNVVATVTPATATFFAAHECGHHVLGHAVRNIPFSREQEADCFAITELVRQGIFRDSEIRTVQAELAAFARADWTHLPGPQRAINLRACLQTAGTQRGRSHGDDSCEYANDGACDEPTVCRIGTDATDCRSRTTPAVRTDDSCEYANDGACDEPTVCRSGTDATDCSNRATPAARRGRDSCEYANDGTCDEPNVCPRGTDSSDCNAASRPRRSSGSNSCEYAFDGSCDEPNVCDVGTDSSDCRAERSTARRRPAIQVCQTAYGSCPMVVRGFTGGSCLCQVGYNSAQGTIVEN